MKNHTVYIIAAGAEEAAAIAELIVKHNEGWLAINPWRISPAGIKDLAKDDLVNRVWWLTSKATAVLVADADDTMLTGIESDIASYLDLPRIKLDELKEGPDGEEAVSVG